MYLVYTGFRVFSDAEIVAGKKDAEFYYARSLVIREFGSKSGGLPGLVGHAGNVLSAVN